MFGGRHARPVYPSSALLQSPVPLGVPGPTPKTNGYGGTGVGSPELLFDAGDAMSADLSEIMSALMGDDNVLGDDCYRIADGEGFDPLLILREIEILPPVRGYGVGAWSSARSIGILARDAGTLLATKAPPLHRSDFLTTPAVDLDRELTATESAAWRAAQVKIGKHWRRTLGLTPLPSHPDILVGTVETACVPLRASLDAWTDHGAG